MEPNLVGEIIRETGPWGALCLFLIYQLIRDRRRNNHSGNPGSVNLLLGGMDAKLTGIKEAIEDMDEGEEKRHNRMRGSVTELQEAIDKLAVTVNVMDERTKGSAS